MEFLPPDRAAEGLARFRRVRPLVQCLTNEVVQEITANVLLAAGASPAMVVAEEEAETFARAADAVLINIGTPYPARLNAMRSAALGAAAASHPWVLDPVGAGGLPWRNDVIRSFVELRPAVIRGNASEILFLAGEGSGARGVDSTAASDEALEGARRLARSSGSVVCVTGKTDFVTNGERTLAVCGGDPMTTLVVGTGCSLSALVAAFCGAMDDTVEAAALACTMAKRASEIARAEARGPGSFHNAYLDALYLIKPEDLCHARA